MNFGNRRKNSRVPFQATITLIFPEKIYRDCETRDLSLKGVFVLGIADHELGEQCDVSLHLVGASSALALKMKGEVVRTESDGLALHFYETDLDSFYHLKNILYYNSGDPDKLEEEFSDQVFSYQALD